MQVIWDQLALSEPAWKCTDDAASFATYQEHQQLITLLMALHDRYESVRASLLHRSPLPSLDGAVTELISEETRLGTKPHNTSAVLVTSYHKPQSSRLNNECTYCHETTHILLKCPHRVCKHCGKKNPNHYTADCYKNPAQQTHSKPVTAAHSCCHRTAIQSNTRYHQ